MPYDINSCELKSSTLLAAFASLCITICAAPTSALAGNDAAHAIVEKFAAESPPRDASNKTNPQNSLKNTPKNIGTSQSQNRNAGGLKEQTTAPEMRDKQARRKAEAERKRAQAAKRARYEQDMLARARAEAATNKDQTATSNNTIKTPTSELKATDKFEFEPTPTLNSGSNNSRQRITVKPPSRSGSGQFVETDLEALARKREAESAALAEKLRRARETHRAINPNRFTPAEHPAGRKNDDQVQPNTTTTETTRSRNSKTAISAFPQRRARAPASDLAEPTMTAKPVTHVTVLLVMKPGKKGIRRWKKTADPMLCFNKQCYISRGKALAAQRITRKRAFGPGIALGKRAGACSNSLTCVFRDVQLAKDGPSMQPIDLRIVRHDRRKRRNVKPDRSCHIMYGRLHCGHRVEAHDWVAWVVPESIAKHAGPSRLSAALAAKLATSAPTKNARR
ncbi:MAG: hypothetical protein ACRBCJ_02360 [Hyphomicrobiaceae bacterium]